MSDYKICKKIIFSFLILLFIVIFISSNIYSQEVPKDKIKKKIQEYNIELVKKQNEHIAFLKKILTEYQTSTDPDKNSKLEVQLIKAQKKFDDIERFILKEKRKLYKDIQNSPHFSQEFKQSLSQQINQLSTNLTGATNDLQANSEIADLSSKNCAEKIDYIVNIKEEISREITDYNNTKTGFFAAQQENNSSNINFLCKNLKKNNSALSGYNLNIYSSFLNKLTKDYNTSNCPDILKLSQDVKNFFSDSEKAKFLVVKKEASELYTKNCINQKDLSNDLEKLKKTIHKKDLINNLNNSIIILDKLNTIKSLEQNTEKIRLAKLAKEGLEKEMSSLNNLIGSNQIAKSHISLTDKKNLVDGNQLMLDSQISLILGNAKELSSELNTQIVVVEKILSEKFSSDIIKGYSKLDIQSKITSLKENINYISSSKKVDLKNYLEFSKNYSELISHSEYFEEFKDVFEDVLDSSDLENYNKLLEDTKNKCEIYNNLKKDFSQALLYYKYNCTSEISEIESEINTITTYNLRSKNSELEKLNEKIVFIISVMEEDIIKDNPTKKNIYNKLHFDTIVEDNDYKIAIENAEYVLGLFKRDGVTQYSSLADNLESDLSLFNSDKLLSFKNYLKPIYEDFTKNYNPDFIIKFNSDYDSDITNKIDELNQYRNSLNLKTNETLDTLTNTLLESAKNNLDSGMEEYAQINKLKIEAPNLKSGKDFSILKSNFDTTYKFYLQIIDYKKTQGELVSNTINQLKHTSDKLDELQDFVNEYKDIESFNDLPKGFLGLKKKSVCENYLDSQNTESFAYLAKEVAKELGYIKSSMDKIEELLNISSQLQDEYTTVSSKYSTLNTLNNSKVNLFNNLYTQNCVSRITDNDILNLVSIAEKDISYYSSIKNNASNLKDRTYTRFDNLDDCKLNLLNLQNSVNDTSISNDEKYKEITKYKNLVEKSCKQLKIEYDSVLLENKKILQDLYAKSELEYDNLFGKKEILDNLISLNLSNNSIFNIEKYTVIYSKISNLLNDFDNNLRDKITDDLIINNYLEYSDQLSRYNKNIISLKTTNNLDSILSYDQYTTYYSKYVESINQFNYLKNIYDSMGNVTPNHVQEIDNRLQESKRAFENISYDVSLELYTNINDIYNFVIDDISRLTSTLNDLNQKNIKSIQLAFLDLTSYLNLYKNYHFEILDNNLPVVDNHYDRYLGRYSLAEDKSSSYFGDSTTFSSLINELNSFTSEILQTNLVINKEIRNLIDSKIYSINIKYNCYSDIIFENSDMYTQSELNRYNNNLDSIKDKLLEIEQLDTIEYSSRLQIRNLITVVNNYFIILKGADVQKKC
ncbi:MAG: hypothetical protein PHU32_00725 [Candidatus ainarchaeum sp.]|nr:hypothetical protein [Candidatus ainarchaeum sp.]